MAAAETKNLKKLLRKLEKIKSRRVRNASKRKAIRAGGSVVIKEVRPRVRKRTGTARRSIVQKPIVRGDVADTQIGARNKLFANGKNPAKYFAILEKKYPALRPGFDAAKQPAQRAMADKLREELIKVAK